MVAPEFLRHLRCPVTGSTLRLLPADALHRVNERITHGQIVNQLGDLLERPLTDGLINQDDSLIYPVWDDIPTLIPEEALPTSQLN